MIKSTKTNVTTKKTYGERDGSYDDFFGFGGYEENDNFGGYDDFDGFDGNGFDGNDIQPPSPMP